MNKILYKSTNAGSVNKGKVWVLEKFLGRNFSFLLSSPHNVVDSQEKSRSFNRPKTECVWRERYRQKDMSPNGPRALAIRARMIADATDAQRTVAMKIAGVSHDDATPIGVMVWLKTGRLTNNYKEIIVRCPGGWVAAVSFGNTEDGVAMNHILLGCPAPCAPYEGWHGNTPEEFREEAERGGFLFLSKDKKRGCMYFNHPRPGELPKCAGGANRLVAETLDFIAEARKK